MKHRLIIGLLLLSLFGACAQEVVDVVDEKETEIESINKDETIEESETTESNTSEDTQTKTSKQKRHGAIESESVVISAYDLFKNEEI